MQEHPENTKVQIRRKLSYHIEPLEILVGLHNNWVTQQTRQHVTLAFSLLDLSLNLKKPKVRHILQANKPSPE